MDVHTPKSKTLRSTLDPVKITLSTGSLSTEEVKYLTYYLDIQISYESHKQNILSGTNRLTLAKGQHQFPFSFVLPHQIPSSFEGVHGNVRYTIRAVYER